MNISEKKEEGKARFGITMSTEVFEELEKRRRLIPRAPYIEHCLKQYFEFTGFLDELLATLPENPGQEGCDKLRTIVDTVRSRILERKRSILP